MAGIQALSVRGIRSFGPEDNDEQRISFEKPLTLILGQNGCGKTTIIECLRYAITGQTPPGSRNECFVHDAKINRSTEVLAQVKLKVINAKDNQLEIARSMKVTALPKKKSKFQTLDSFLSVIDESGNAKDLSSRCADLDFMIQEELGVSKAIINSVILCHQEDSSWPLDEGKKVKERFDEIFDADKYSDCFDRLKKIRKEYTVVIKMLTQEVAHLTEKKEELDKKKLDVVNTETRISEAELKIVELDKELTPITEKINAIINLQKNIVQIESKKEKIKTKLEHNKTQEEELTKVIKTLFEGTTEELQENITNYGSTAKAKKKELDESHKKVFNFNKEEERTANDMAANESKVSRLVVLEGQQQERCASRAALLLETATLAETDVGPTETAAEAAAAAEKLTERVTSLHAALKEQRAAADKVEKELQQHVDDARDQLSRHKQQIYSKETEVVKLNKEITKKNKEINDATESRVKLEAIEKKLAAAEEECAAAAADLDPEAAQQQITDDEKLIETQEKELDQLSEKISKVQKQSGLQKERALAEQTAAERRRARETLANKHRAALLELLGGSAPPERDFAVTVKKVECAARSELDAVKKKLKEKQLELARLETARTHARTALAEKRQAAAAARDKLEAACGALAYDAAREKVEEKLKKLQDEQNLLNSSIFVYGKFKEQLRDNKCCPLCSRGFDSDQDADALMSEVEQRVSDVPSRLEAVSEQLSRLAAERDRLLRLEPVTRDLARLDATDIPKHEEKLTEVEKNLESAAAAVETLQRSAEPAELRLRRAAALLPDMPLLDTLTRDLAKANTQLEKVQLQCVDLDTETDLEAAQGEQTQRKTDLAALRAKVKAAQQALNQHNKRLQKMQEQKNKLKEQLLNVQKKVQELVSLQEALQTLEARRETARGEAAELRAGTAPLDALLAEKQAAKADAVNTHRNAIDVKRSYINLIESSFEKVKSVMKEIKQHEEKNVPQEMEKIKAANEVLLEKKRQLMTDRDEITKRIETLKEELAKQEINKRELEDNLKLRKAQAEVASCTRELEELETRLAGCNLAELGDKQPLIADQTRLFRDKARTEGQRTELKEHLKQLKAELVRAQNKNVETKHREKFHELQVTRALERDILLYANALEKCVMDFHSEKMENINLIIKEMWRKIYRGNDIDHIEIKTESCMTADSERRKYDYRVVQCKNGVEIDMRGRCSAGQKVLACLIIRLALAETFSSRFGILALDEPTTNLDSENVRSLCEALAEIVQERRRQRNFMFIVITHDREFLEALGHVDKVSHYYEVSRNDNGNSRIKKIRFT